MLIEFYQKYISPLSKPNCRFYPTCSEYGKWQFDVNPYPIALFNTVVRILRCNKFFEGGIDYPTAKCPTKISRDRDLKIKYWFVPKEGGKCYVIKNLD